MRRSFGEGQRLLPVRLYEDRKSYKGHEGSFENNLTGLGVRTLFRETYGSDLLGVWKNGPSFYQALLEHARIEPADAVTVDDDALRLDRARDLGMETILVGTKDAGSGHRRIGTIADLPGALASG